MIYSVHIFLKTLSTDCSALRVEVAWDKWNWYLDFAILKKKSARSRLNSKLAAPGVLSQLYTLKGDLKYTILKSLHQHPALSKLPDFGLLIWWKSVNVRCFRLKW